jgi:ABC-type cobalt transport system substrate-binding protein
MKGKKILLIVLIIVLIVGVCLCIKNLGTEKFNGGFDPSVRSAIAGIGPFYEDPNKIYCPTCL